MHVSLPEMLAGLDLFILEDLERLLLLLILLRRSEHRPARKLFRLEELRLLLVDLIEGDFFKLGSAGVPQCFMGTKIYAGSSWLNWLCRM